MSAVAWTFLVLVVLALAAASVWRRRTPAALPPRPTAPLPRADDLGTLGLSAARPVGASPVRASPAEPTASRPEAASRPGADARLDDEEPGWRYDTGRTTTTVAPPDAEVPDEPDDTPPAEDVSGGEPSVDEPSGAEPSGAEPSGDGVATARPTLASPLTAPAAPTFVAPDSPLWVAPGPPEHLLASLAACIGGTVAVLRRAADGYHVDALAGLPTGASPAPLAADGAHPLDRAPLDRVLSILDGDDLAALTYLPDGSARTALVRALDETPEPRVLVAVTLGVDADHVDADTARLIGDYVNLLAALRADDAPGGAPDDDEGPDAEPVTDDALASDDALAGDDPEPAGDDGHADDGHVDDGDAPGPADDASPEAPTAADEDAEPADDGAVVEVAAPREGAPRRAPDALPRSVILAGEIAAARAAHRPLAFALVTRADAEALLDDEARANAAEAELAALLRAAPRVRRVEPFGPMLLAVFLDAEPDQVPVWARSLGGPPLHVGAVAPAAGDPEAVRRAAARALERAYAQGAVCLLAD